MAPAALAQVVRPLAGIFPSGASPEMLVGLGSGDDAAVYRLDDERALVATTDFFTPIVDRPYDFGAIAAANAMSDVYAMGGEMAFALNIAAFPPDLPTEVAGEVLRGAAEKILEAGAVLAGGHTIRDKEPKFGLVAIGFVDPRRILSKGGAAAGDALVLTKPLGSGVVTTAAMRDQATAEQVQQATESMVRLNRAAGAAAVAVGARGATDVTGFGLLGHACEMVASARAVTFELRFARLPFLPGAVTLADQQAAFPGGAYNNREHFAPSVRFAPQLSEVEQLLCFAPETSGGLLIAVSPAQLDQLLQKTEQAWIVGEVVDRVAGAPPLAVVP